jgi:hypothetical protein
MTTAIRHRHSNIPIALFHTPYGVTVFVTRQYRAFYGDYDSFPYALWRDLFVTTPFRPSCGRDQGSIRLMA